MNVLLEASHNMEPCVVTLVGKVAVRSESIADEVRWEEPGRERNEEQAMQLRDRAFHKNLSTFQMMFRWGDIAVSDNHEALLCIRKE